MKTTHFMKIGFVALISAATAACSSTPSTPTYRVDAYIQSMERAPDKCVQKTEGGGNSIVGALIGGVIGNQFGSDSGRVAMTVLGAGAGAAIAGSGGKKGKTQCSRDGYIATVSYIHPASNQMVTKRLPLERRTTAKYINIVVE
jgi:uncharacterized protein YcfJ